MIEKTYIQVRNSQINDYVDFPLYFLTSSNRYMMYKPAGESLEPIRLSHCRHPDLFIHEKDRISALQELYKKFNGQLINQIRAGNLDKVKEMLCIIVEETLNEPRSGILQVLPETVDIVVSEYSKNPKILNTFASITSTDYTTAMHSVNVMALILGICFYNEYSVSKTKQFALSALLHDVGKSQIPKDILNAKRKLTDAEFDKIKSHTTIGMKIILENGISDQAILLGAIEHHEKLDGSGYPHQRQNISYLGQMLGVIDAYEAITNDDRPYRRELPPYKALKLLKKDVEEGKLNRQIFEMLCFILS